MDKSDEFDNEYDSDEPENGADEAVSGDNDRAYRDAMYDYFVKHIGSADRKERDQAIATVSELECDPRLSGILERMITDADPETNAAAVECIALWKHTDGTDLLINFMTSADNQAKLTEPFRESVLLALGQTGDQAAYEYLSHYSVAEFDRAPGSVSVSGMACNESIMVIASRGHEGALRFLTDGCRHAAWNMRESCAACLGALFGGKSGFPKTVYDELMRLTTDDNKNVRIAAYMSLDEIIGLDAANKKILSEARTKQIREEALRAKPDNETE